MKTHLHEISMDWFLKGVKSRFGTALKHYDDGMGPLFVYQSADFDFGVIRAQSWEDAYEIVEDEILPRATHEEVLADFPEFADFEQWEKAANAGHEDARHSLACFEESYGFSGNNGMYHKPLNGERLEPLTPALVKELEIKLSWERYENA